MTAAVVFTVLHDYSSSLYCATRLQQYFKHCYMTTAVINAVIMTTAVIYILLHDYSSILYCVTCLQQYFIHCYMTTAVYQAVLKNYCIQSIKSLNIN